MAEINYHVEEIGYARRYQEILDSRAEHLAFRLGKTGVNDVELPSYQPEIDLAEAESAKDS